MMSRVLKIVLKVLGWAVAGILAVALGLVAVCVWLHATADLNEPDFVPSEQCAVKLSDSLRVYGGNTLRLNADGLWVMSVAGSAFERGEAIGKLAEDLLYLQEKVFADKLFEMVPSRRYRDFLHYFITIFNRRLGSSVPLEYRQEIKAMSTSCTHELDDFGNPYERQMQYHSAHDIGHVMQDYMLVGCTSFAAWGRESADSSLIIARNFDFYMGEEFARNKLVLFEKPDTGHAFVCHVAGYARGAFRHEYGGPDGYHQCCQIGDAVNVGYAYLIADQEDIAICVEPGGSLENSRGVQYFRLRVHPGGFRQ